LVTVNFGTQQLPQKFCAATLRSFTASNIRSDTIKHDGSPIFLFIYLRTMFAVGDFRRIRILAQIEVDKKK